MKPISLLRIGWFVFVVGVAHLAGQGVYEPYDFIRLPIKVPAGSFPSSIVPRDLAVDASGTMYVSDAFNRIFKVAADGTATLLAGSSTNGGADGVGAAASFRQPWGLAVDSAGNVWVADTGNHAIRKITPGGAVTTVAGKAEESGFADGSGIAARFNYPHSLVIDSADNVYVTDTGNKLVRKISPGGSVTTFAGRVGIGGGLDGPSGQATFDELSGITIDHAGSIYPLGRNPSKIRKISTSNIVSTVAGNDAWGFVDGTGSAAKFYLPEGLAVDGAGSLYVADTNNSTIRKVTAAGVVTTLGGMPNSYGSVEGAGADALMLGPTGIFIGANGRLYVVERGESSAVIRIGGPAGTYFEPNDLFRNRTVLTGGSPSGSGNNARAKAETGEPDHAGTPAAKSEWWEWTAPGFGRLSVSTGGSTFDTVVAVYTGSDLTHLTLIGENDEGAGDSTSRISVFVTPGTVYKIVVDGYNGASGNIALNLSFTPTSTIYATDFENFPSGANWLGGFDGWYATNVKDAVQGIYPDVTGSAAGRVGFGRTSDEGVYALRPVNYDPVASGTNVVEFSTDVAIVDSTTSARDNFHFLLYNQRDELVTGINFDNTTKFINRFDGERFTYVGAYVPGTRYALSLSMNFATHRWSAKLGATTLFTDQPMNVKGATYTLGHLGAYWEIMTKGSPGDNYMTFDNYRLKLSDSLPRVVTPPASVTVGMGSSAVFTVMAEGDGLSYQWKKNNVVIPGATAAAYMIPAVAAGDAGSYSVTIINPMATIVASAATLTVVGSGDPGRLINASVRIVSGTDANVLIMGFVLGGAGTSGSKSLLIRGIGPTLADFGVPAVMLDPLLQIIPGGGSTPLVSNDNWGGETTVTSVANAVGAFALSNTASKDAALVTSLGGGIYSAKIPGVSATTGTVLAEIYDATPGAFNPSAPRLINLSARAPMSNDNPLIAGFVIGGSTAKTVLIRAIGPYLTQFLGSAAMSDPKLELYVKQSGTDQLVLTNDNWGGSPLITSVGGNVGAFALSDPASKDAILLVTLAPGIYSAKVLGVNNNTGIALVEIYEIP